MKAIIEIPKNSNIKYEYDFKTDSISVDRILYGTNVYPENYGSVLETMDYDGDPLDIVLISNVVLNPKTYVDVRIIGVLIMIDDNEIDNKLITVMEKDPEFFNVKSLKDLSKNRQQKIIDFFSNYKKLENKTVELKGFENVDKAMKIYHECKNLYLKNKAKILSSSK